MAAISRLLANLTRKDNKEFVWTQACEEAFKEIKQLLTTAPLLRPPNFEKEYVLWIDAIENALELYWSREMMMVNNIL